MRRLLKGLVRLIFVVVPLVLLAAGLGIVWLSRSLPATSGTVRIAGLTGQVTITRDANGVPHVDGATRDDVYAGLGFAQAQDRMWQMELNRMAGQGRLSEIFGKPTVPTDIWLRTMDLYGAARDSLKAMDPRARKALDAYSRGVNAWLDQAPPFFASRLPPEFVILGHDPEPWTAADTLVTIKMMSVQLSENLGEEINRLALARQGLDGPEIDDLLPPLDSDHPPALPDLRKLLGFSARPDLREAAGRERAGLDRLAVRPGSGASNNWVVSGSRTSSGKPILANDPHLGLTAPSIWYLADLRVEKEFDRPRNMTGVTLPGAPFVLLGRSTSLAWGFTNTGADVQDIFVEKVDPDDPQRYLTPSGWAKFGEKTETIHVSGGDNVIFTRRWTRHGPVLPATYRRLGELLPRGTVAALAWTGLAHDDTTGNVGYDMWNFRTVADFQNGMKDFITPVQSMVVADTGGSIGLIAPGRVPVRDPENKVMGRAPVPGWNPLYDWKGFIPFSALPRQTNPARGAIGTANTKIVGPDYPHFLTFDWDEPYRQERIDSLIVDAPGKQTMETSRKAQGDVYSMAFAEIRPRMLKLVAGRDQADADVLAGLEHWDDRMVANSAEPLIFMAWIRQAMKDIYSDDLGPAFRPWFRIRVRALERALGDHPARDWCDDRKTDAVEDCGAILARALSESLRDLSRRYGDDRSNWQWGRIHVAEGRHRPFSEVPVLRRIFDVEVPSPGGPFTLDRGVSDVESDADPFGNTHAASYRGIFDLADLDKSTYIQTTGQSGNVFSRHYSDFARPWAEVRSITIPTDPAAYSSRNAGVWHLDPPQ